MYLSGTIDIDPSKETRVQRVKPTRAFARLLHFLTAGLSSPREEEETFTAIAILQQINRALRRLRITDVVHLAKDEFDIYLDEEGKSDDMAQAMQAFADEVDPIESEVFENLRLVLEHEECGLQYLIEVDIRRLHPVGEYPIRLVVNAAPSELRATPGESAEASRARLEPIFESQQTYEAFTRRLQGVFEAFLENLAHGIRRSLPITDLKTELTWKMVRPRAGIDPAAALHRGRTAPAGQTVVYEPMYYGYPAMADFFAYSFLWSSMCHSHHIHVHDVTVVDEAGASMFDVNGDGFDAGSTSALSPDEPFSPPDTGVDAYYGDHAMSDDFQSAGLSGGEDGSSWLSGGESSFEGAEPTSSCSSCSSCGSCFSD